MRPTRYILLADHTPLPMDGDDNLLIWAQWMDEPANRRVARTDVGPFWVSTVFLALDHSFAFDDEGAPPILFETMVFAREPDEEIIRRGQDFDCRRYATWDEAVAGHDLTVQLVRASLERAPASPPTPPPVEDR